LKATVNIIKDLVDVISATVIITNATDNLDGTFTLESENTYWLSKDDTITIDSETYVVTQFSQNIEFTIMPTGNGGLPTVDSFELQQPTYIHGTLRMAKNEVNAIKNKMDLVPFVYLYEVIRDKKNTDEASAIDRETILRIFFLNSSSFKDMLTEDVYEYIINPMQTMVDEFLNKVKNSRYFTENMDYETIPLVNFSDEGEQQKSIFDINLSGIELRLSAEIRKDLSCTDYIAPTPPTPTCLDAELIINETTEISIGSGEIFDLSVTLDGNPSGTYNALTDTWEVESEPCPPCEIDITFDSIPLGTATTSPYNIDCSTEIDIVIVSDSRGLDGLYSPDGMLNDRNIYYSGTNSIFYNGTNWVIQGSGSENAAAGDEAYPWLATWGISTVVQGTISEYCGGGVCADATYDIKDSANTTLYSGSIVSGGSLDQTITDSVAVLKDTDGNTLSTTNILAEGSENITAPDGDVTVNSSAFGNVKSNGSLDVPVEYVNGTPVGTIVGGVVQVPNPIVPSGIAYQRPSLTGQTTSYRTGDDAWQVANNPYSTAPTNPTHIARLVNFTTLAENNAFGNTNRFTDSVGGQTYVNNYVIDHFTGLGIYRVLSLATDWNNSIDNALSSTQNGLAGWKIPNYNEWLSVCDFSLVDNKLDYAPFSISGNSRHWTSTTLADTTANAWFFQRTMGGIVKTTSTNFYLLFRNHY